MTRTLLYFPSPQQLALLLLGFRSFDLVPAAFTRQICTKTGMCVDQEPGTSNPATYCGYPLVSAITSGVSCPTASQFTVVTATHLAQNHSIAYYGLNMAFLGDRIWSVPSDRMIYVCASGVSADGIPKTQCAWAEGNDTRRLHFLPRLPFPPATQTISIPNPPTTPIASTIPSSAQSSAGLESPTTIADSSSGSGSASQGLAPDQIVGIVAGIVSSVIGLIVAIIAMRRKKNKKLEKGSEEDIGLAEQ